MRARVRGIQTQRFTVVTAGLIGAPLPLERQAEAARQEELRRQAEFERQAEIERQAELAQQAEDAKLAEIERQAEEARLAKIREAQQQSSEQVAAAAATSSVLGVAGSTVKETSGNSAPSIAASRNSVSQPARSNSTAATRPASNEPGAFLNEMPPAAAPLLTASSVGGASTFAFGENTSDSSLGSGANRAAVPAGPLQSFSSGNNVVDSFSNGNRNSAATDNKVPISSLTRTNYVAPVYPRAAQRKEITGSVDVMFTVSTIGTVTDISILRAEPDDTFNQSAMDAVSEWRFEPVIANGVALEKRTAVRLTFDLQ